MLISARKRCTLLVPDYLFAYYEEMIEAHAGLQNFLGFLVRKFYRNRNKFLLQKAIDTTVNFQESGLNLHREDFRPIEWDWVELKLLANSYNMSICAFFVMLLRLEMAGALEGGTEIGGVPPTPIKITLHQTISHYSIPKFIRLLHLRV